MSRRCKADAEQGRREACPNAGEKKVYSDPSRGEAVEPKGGSEATKPWEKERPGAEGMQPTRAG